MDLPGPVIVFNDRSICIQQTRHLTLPMKLRAIDMKFCVVFLISWLKENIVVKSTCICSSISLGWGSEKNVVSRQVKIRPSDTSRPVAQNYPKVVSKLSHCSPKVVPKLRSMPCHGRWRSDHPILHAGGNLLDTCAPNCAPRWSAIWLCIFLCCVICCTICCTICAIVPSAELYGTRLNRIECMCSIWYCFGLYLLNPVNLTAYSHFSVQFTRKSF